MLSFENINVAIAGVPVLRNVSFSLKAGASAALIGRNGAGKTTTVRTIMGFTEASGTVRLGGQDLGRVASHRRPSLGIGYAPEDRRLFSAFTVEENILLPGRVAKLGPQETRHRLDRAYSVLPELKELARRPAGSVSGGQGKMVALGRALMLGTRLLILDEPFQGLDRQRMERARDWLDAHLRPDQTLIVVTHDPAEIPQSVTRWLRLDGGRVV